MTREELRIGETYLLSVVVTELGDGNMVRCVTPDDGEVVYAHPEALRGCYDDDRK